MNLCICQLIKDEQQYIEEWIEYHHDLGFNKFYLIEDYCSSDHSEVLKKYDYVELYKLMDIATDEEKNLMLQGVYRQNIVYRIFERLWKNKNDWMAFIDPDEFICYNKTTFIETLNLLKDDVPYIEMVWRIMKCNGHIMAPNNGKKYSVLNTYTTYRNDYVLTSKKQIINCNKKFNDLTSEKSFIDLPHHFDKPSVNINIVLKHFLCKSFEEWVNRLQYKGELITAYWNRRLDDWFTVNDEYVDIKEILYKKFKLNDFKYLKNDFTI